ncbi:MAG: laccase domain-containing protein, partial [Gammaproteobacteria bacterium]
VLEQFPERENKKSQYLNLYQIARQRLFKMGIEANNVYGGNFCTYTEKNRFFSYRRDKDKQSGRMASLIYRL